MPTRAENRRQTLLALGEAAIDLFEAEGPSVTVDVIAERAGVSRRTVFRHVQSKEELAFVHPLLWFDAFDAALIASADLALVDRLRVASLAIAAEIDADPEPPRRAFLVAAGHPGLNRGFQSLFQRWVDRIAEVVAEAEARAAGDLDATTTPVQRDPFRARIVGSAVMGMVDAVTRAWLVADPGTTYAELAERGFTVVAPLLEVPPGDAGR